MKPFLFILLSLSTTVSARLMESREDCLKRYGEPTKSDKNTFTWQKAGVIVTANFQSAECHQIQFEKADKSYFTDAERQALQEANGNGQKWEEQSIIFNANWKTSDGRHCEAKGKSIIFWTKEGRLEHERQARMNDWMTRKAAENEAAKKAAAEKKKLEDF